MSMVDVEVFKAYAPLSKTAQSTNGDWYISGIASTDTKDWDGDTIEPDSLDINYLVKQGKINYEHDNALDHIIGEPTANTYVDKSGLHLEAMLYKDVPLAKQAWDLANAMEKSNAKRSLGFSIEGAGIPDPDQPHTYKRVKVMNVAVTANPANPDATWHTFKKSIDSSSELFQELQKDVGNTNAGSADTGNDALTGYVVDPEQMTGLSSFRVEDLPKAVNLLTYALGRRDCDKLLNYSQKELANRGLLSPRSKQVILQLGRGVSAKDAKSFLNQE